MRRLIFTLAALLALNTPTLAAPLEAKVLAVERPWSRPAAVGTNGAGFMALRNRGNRADTLVSIESAVADRVEIHQSTMADGIMSMRHLTSGLRLGPGQTVVFAPGGYHVMFVKLAKASRVGDSIPAVLIFQSGTRLKVLFPVMPASSGNPTTQSVHRW
jgi:periplasmic copper chaperone A